VFGKINCLKIIRDHTLTLRKYGQKTISPLDFVIFYILPAIISIIIVIFFHQISKNVISLLITALSIFAALLFNLLLLIHDSITKPYTGNIKPEDRKTYLKEIFSSISFSILVSVMAIILLLVHSQFLKGIIDQSISTFFIYYLVIVFIFTLLMILKRIHILLSDELK
jgi:hypothetical protein